MRTALTIAAKDLRLLLRDRGALFWACVFPLAFALLFGAIYPHGSSTKITVAVDRESAALATSLVGLNVLVVDDGFARVQRGEAVAALRTTGKGIDMAIDPSRGAEAAFVEAAVMRGACAIPLQRHTVAGAAPRSGFELAFPAAVLWGLIGCAGAFAAASMAERRSGTHLRLRAAPVRLFSLVLGKWIACIVACAADASLLVLIARIGLGVRIERFAALPLAIASCAICFGGITVLLGVLGRTEQAVGGASWATLLLFAMIGGAMVPLSVMPAWMRALSDVSPVKWGIVALEGTTFRGLPFSEVLPACVVLLMMGFAALASGALLQRRAT
jgi:ABC-2 type transport system permease protein